MIAKAKTKDFEPCPEYTGRAMCVDVTPLKKVTTAYGEREVFRFVFEIDEEREDGSRWCVWSSGFTLTLSEKASLRKFLRNWLGRELTQAELDGFDVETMLHKDAFIVVNHNSKDGVTFANIASCTPLRGVEPLKPSGKFVRAQDRAQDRDKNGGGGGGGGSDASFRRTSAPAGAGEAEEGGPEKYLSTKVHVGKHAGQELRDLSEERIKKLCENWLPTMKASPKTTADDRRLIAALEWWQSEQTKTAVPVPDDADF